MLEAPNEGDWDLRVTPAFIEAAWIAGFRTVRLPVRWSNHAASTAPYSLEPVFLRRVESVVDALLARGFQVVVDMHHHRQLDGDALDVGEFAVEDAVLHERFANMWAQIAQRFAGRSSKLLFELYNEPHGRLTPALWNALANQALQKIRQSDPTRLVLIGPSPWYDASGLANLTLPDDRNLMVTVHNYAPFNFTHQGASWITPVQPTGVTCCTPEQQQAIQQPLAQAKAWSVAAGYPVVLGEFGAYSLADMPSRVTYSRLVRNSAESHGMPWMVWDFAGGFGVYDPSTGLLRAELTNALLGP